MPFHDRIAGNAEGDAGILHLNGRPCPAGPSERMRRLSLAGVGIGREAISRIETGDRFVTDYELVIFSRVLGVSLEWLTGDLKE